MRRETRDLKKQNTGFGLNRRFAVNIQLVWMGVLVAGLTILWRFQVGPVYAADSEEQIIASYQAYQERFDSIETMWEIEEQGYEIVEKHVFDIPLVKFLPERDEFGELVPAEVIRPENLLKVAGEDALMQQQVPTLRFFPALEKESHRAAVFLADSDGRIVYKCNRLECNYVVLGELKQPVTDIISVAFQDLDQDGLMDIILIAGCVNETGAYAGKTYKVGEVLFQRNDNTGWTSFYRDWRVNDKINRFGMNMSARSIIAFVRDEQSTEFLYTATTEEELLENGFVVIKEQSYWRNYEKLGNLKLLPGIYSMAYYDIFMIYLVNEQGDIVWSFQPMEDYDNLYSLRGMSGKDLDGDGMKDMLVVAKYSREGENGEMIIDNCCAIYYQRTGGFDQDTEFAQSYHYTKEDTVEGLINKIRAYWGWQTDGVENR